MNLAINSTSTAEQLFQIAIDDSPAAVQCSILTSEQLVELRKVEHFTWDKTTRQFIQNYQKQTKYTLADFACLSSRTLILNRNSTIFCNRNKK